MVVAGRAAVTTTADEVERAVAAGASVRLPSSAASPDVDCCNDGHDYGCRGAAGDAADGAGRKTAGGAVRGWACRRSCYPHGASARLHDVRRRAW